MDDRRADLPCCEPVLQGALSELEATELAENFKVLADPARLRLLSLIAARPEAQACVCDLVDAVGRSQPTVSHHLKVLAEVGLVEREKRGRWAWFRLVPERMEALRAALEPRAS